MAQKDERTELEMKIRKYREIGNRAVSDELTKQRIAAFVAELEQKVRKKEQ